MLLRCTIIFSLFLISSCSSGLKRDLGLMREVPDEFRVISQPDLSIPPNFDLVPPAYPVQNYNFGQQEKTVVNKHLTKDEAEFIGVLKLPESGNKIRDEITSENVSHDYTKSKTVISRLKSIIQKEDADNSIVSPIEENKRIQDNIKNNKKIDEGEVASTKKEKTIIDKVIGK